jgi:hypothetical protein
MLDLMELTQRGGKPSNSFGSKYSEICKLVQQYNGMVRRPKDTHYLPITARTLLFKIQDAIKKFNASNHGPVSGKKSDEKDVLEMLSKNIEAFDIKVAMMSKLLDNYESLGSSTLIKNSMKGWKSKLQTGGFSIQFSHMPGVNMQVNNGTKIVVRTAMFGDYFTNISATNLAMEKTMVSILVHEYHHVLTNRATPLYYDEFVAHWKQYDAAGVRLDLVDRVTKLNEWLEEAYHVTFPHPTYTKVTTGPEQTGTFWTNHIDNGS